MTKFKDTGGWAFDPICPCDAQFVEYFLQQGFRDKVVFHFGSGLHHLVGTTLARAEGNNRVLAITAGKAEYLSYIERVLEDPALGQRYALIFGDIYTLDKRLLPHLDLVTLFHLCETSAADRDPHDFLLAVGVVETFLDRLGPDGLLLLYGGSTGIEPTRSIVALLERMGRLARAGEHASLLIYRKMK
jgi:hypothetical protein